MHRRTAIHPDTGRRWRAGEGGSRAGVASLCALLAIALVSAGCGSPIRDTTGAAASVNWPEWRELESDASRYRVSAEHSALRIIVLADGAMARFGHPHVIGGPVLSGEIIRTPVFEHTRVDLRIDVSALMLDRPEWRQAEGFDADLDAEDIADTRRNLLGEAVLDAARYPSIAIRSVAIAGPAWQPDVTIRIRLRDTVRERTVPVSLRHDDNRLEATGQLRLRQTDFGMEPFSAVGGALRVADELLVRFRLVAYRDGSEG